MRFQANAGKRDNVYEYTIPATEWVFSLSTQHLTEGVKWVAYRKKEHKREN